MTSFQQNLEEYYEKDNFFFIQVGANDGVQYDFIREKIDKYGWGGVLVEPQKAIFKLLKENYRNYKNLFFENIAISDKKEERILYIIEGSSGFHATLLRDGPPYLKDYADKIIEEKVRCETLNYIICKYNINSLDLLKIDAEGFDYEVVMSLEFDIIKPSIIWYEHYYLTAQKQEACILHLKKNNYIVSQTSKDTVGLLPRNVSIHGTD